MFSISSFAWGPLETPHSRPCGTPSSEFMKSLIRRVVRDPGHLDEKSMVGLWLGFQNSRVESLLKSTATNLKMEFAHFFPFSQGRDKMDDDEG